MSLDPPDRPQAPNPFAVRETERLDDETLGDQIRTYREILARLDPNGHSVLRPRDQVAAALAELEAERARRGA